MILLRSLGPNPRGFAGKEMGRVERCAHGIGASGDGGPGDSGS